MKPIELGLSLRYFGISPPANAPSRYSRGVTPSHFLNVLWKTLGSEKPSR